MSEVSAVLASEDVARAERRWDWSSALAPGFLAKVGFVVASFAIYIGWIGRDGREIEADHGIGYALGIIGGIPMVLLMLYSLRKRVAFMRYLGPVRYWFQGHMTLGVVGPVFILYHCNFEVGSMNSEVALWCTLLVASSGLVGRYLYARIHNGLYGRKISLKELTNQLSVSADHHSTRGGFVDEVREEFRALAEQVLAPPETLWEALLRAVVMAFRTRWLYIRMSWTVRRKLIARSVASPSVARHRDGIERATRRFLRANLPRIRRVTQFNASERLFALWHVIHVPVFFLMVLSVLVHILAVHMY